MKKNDVIIIGAGAAGLLAAISAAKSGVSVLLIEKMKRSGTKLKITGKGRCNITNSNPLNEFITHFGKNGKFLYQAFSRFFSNDIISLLQSQGVDTVSERGGRIFPKSNKASDVVEALIRELKKHKVTTSLESKVEGLIIEDGVAKGVRVGKKKYFSDKVIIATGGVSYSGTGSTGDGYTFAKQAGHTIVPIRPALVGLVTKGDVAQRLQGLSLTNVKLIMSINGKRKKEDIGEMLFTHVGVSGPLILSLSKQFMDAKTKGKNVSLSIDLKPGLDQKKLDARLIRDFNEHGKMKLKTVMKSLLPSKLIPVCLDLVGLDSEKLCNQVNAGERTNLLNWLKDFQVEAIKQCPIEEAIVTAGGVSLKEIDPYTMESKLVKNLFIAGEVLDIDADTGGYNLQAAFSTGWLAGLSIDKQ